MHPRIGLSVMPLETRREAIIDLATEGDRLGYDGFFMPETWTYDMTVLLADAAARTHPDYARDRDPRYMESQFGDHRDGRGNAARNVGRTLRARPRRQH